MEKVPTPVGEPTIHRTAIVEPESRVLPGATIGPYCRVGAGSSVGAGAVLADHVILGPNVVVGDRTSLAPGAYVHSGTLIEEDVLVGPNVVLVGGLPGQEPMATVVRAGAVIGANASVLCGITVGSKSVVGAGSVVTRDVPPYATVVGSPARIVGYASSPQHAATRHLRASMIDDDDLPLAIGRATLARHPRIEDLRGSLTFGETGAHLPFEPQRYFLVFGVPSREVRGEHAHRALHQLLICVAGECAVAVDDGATRGEVMLDRPDVALHIPPMVWGSQYKYSSDAALLVLASAVYDDADYIRTYDEFEAEVGHV